MDDAPGGLDEGDDEEGGMVTGKSTADITGRRNNARGTKKSRRKDRQQDQQRQGEADEDDSSELSDESDDDGDLAQRLVFHSAFSELLFSHFTGLLSRSVSQKCRYGLELDPRQYALVIVMMGRNQWLRHLRIQRHQVTIGQGPLEHL